MAFKLFDESVTDNSSLVFVFIFNHRTEFFVNRWKSYLFLYQLMACLLLDQCRNISMNINLLKEFHNFCNFGSLMSSAQYWILAQ